MWMNEIEEREERIANIKRCYDMAMSDLKQWDGHGFVIIVSEGENPWFDTNYFYDYEVFDSQEEMDKFIQGKCAYNWLDNCTSLRDGEKVVKAWSKTKLYI